jgi:hypothetical protein
MLQCMNCFGTEVNLQGGCAVCGDVMAPALSSDRHEVGEMVHRQELVLRETSRSVEWFNRMFIIFGKELVRN